MIVTRNFLHMRGGSAELGMTLTELEQMLEHARELEYDFDRTRVCKSVQKYKGLIDVYFVEGEWQTQPNPSELDQTDQAANSSSPGQ